MPLYKTIDYNSSTQIFVWHITETLEELNSAVKLKEKSMLRVQAMKSTVHQRAFLSVRMLLKEAGYTDVDLHYDAFGKPFFSDGKYISITHSHQFAAIIIGCQKVGIDIEMQREKITHIANKFLNSEELVEINKSSTADLIRRLTVNWGAKEAIFKIRNERGISFKEHIAVQPFELIDQKAEAILSFDISPKKFALFFEEFEEFSLVWALEN